MAVAVLVHYWTERTPAEVDSGLFSALLCVRQGARYPDDGGMMTPRWDQVTCPACIEWRPF